MRPRRNLRAHRAALILYAGEPEDPDNCAIHLCDNPGCVNPEHLRWGTVSENNWDKIKKGRNKRDLKLDDRALMLLELGVTRRNIASIYNVTQQAIRHREKKP